MTSDSLENIVEGVIFDFDETLVDSNSGYQKAWGEVTDFLLNFLRAKGVEVKREKIYTDVKRVNLERDREGKYDRNLWWNSLLCDYLGINPPDAVVSKITDIYWKATIEGSELFPRTISILEYLRKEGYVLALVTSTDGKEGMKPKRIEKAGLKDYFDEIVISGEDTERKPSPEPFLKACKLLELQAGECVSVGDKPFTDIKGAKRAGMTSILIARKDWEIGCEPDFIIKDLSELKNIL